MSTISEINAFVDKYESLFKERYRKQIANLKSEKNRKILLTFLQNGRVDLAIEFLDEQNKKWIPWLFDLYRESTAMEIERNKNSIKRLDAGEFVFDPTNQRTNNDIKDSIAAICLGLNENQKKLFLYVVNDGKANGLSDEEIIKRWTILVGLTDTQAQRLNDFRNKLKNQQRIDRLDQQAAEVVEPQTDKEIDQLVNGRVDQMQDARVDMDARDVISRIDNDSRITVINQIVDSLGLSQDQVEKEWICRLDDRVRYTHDIHTGMHGQKVLGINGYFLSPSGARLKYPHDPNAPISETANCRCRLIYRLKEYSNGYY